MCLRKIFLGKNDTQDIRDHITVLMSSIFGVFFFFNNYWKKFKIGFHNHLLLRTTGERILLFLPPQEERNIL